ncbi:hypothetical protein WA577_001956, partial [Blastocystis sp. JDR]
MAAPSYDWILSSENLKDSIKNNSTNLAETAHTDNVICPNATQMANPEVPVPIPPEVMSINAAQRLNGGNSGEPTNPPTCSSTAEAQPAPKESESAPAPITPAPQETVEQKQMEVPPPVVVPEAKQEPVKPIHFYIPSSEEPENENRFIDPSTGEKWIRCQNPFCGKWRYVPPEVEMPSADPWFCIMNTWDEDIASCDY